MKFTAPLVVVLAMVVMMSSVQAVPPCPGKICQASFANAVGGPIDCCKWDFNKGPCRWGGTPVSWKVVRTCSEAAKAYTVLTSSNFQGNPAASEECRCNEPNGPTYTVAQACITLKPRADMDIGGQDIPCKSNGFCQICGGVEAIKDACMQDNRCVAFTFEPSTGCGYLKSAPFYKERKGWVAYTRD